MKKPLDPYRFLGLSPEARPEEAERRYQELLDWLGSEAIPPELRPWAKSQAALVEEFYRNLTRGEPQPAQAVPPQKEAPALLAVRRRRWGPLAFALVGVVVGLVVVGGVFYWRTTREASPPPSGPSPAQEFLASQKERINQLEAILARDPKNGAALFELGETYMTAEQWQKVIDWFSRILALDPATLPPDIDLDHIRLDLGIAHMNLGRFDRAESFLVPLVEKNSTDPQLSYILGFLYAVAPQPDMEKAAKYWQEVLRLAPDSQWAQLAKVHLEGLQGRSPPP